MNSFSSTFPVAGQRLGEQTLSRRLDALAEIVRIGRARHGQGENPPQSAGAGGRRRRRLRPGAAR